MKFLIGSSDSGQRLDKFIKRKVFKFTQSLLEKFSRKGIIKLNGKKTKLSYKVKIGDTIIIPNLEIEKKEEKKILKHGLKELTKKIIKNILFKDSEKIIINKPSGLAVHSGSKILLSLNDVLKDLRFGVNEDPRIVHRIDKQTSGLLILARNYKATVELTNQFKEKKINKFYLAILNGVPKKNSGEITNKIRVKKQKDALTKYFVLNKINKYSLILIKPETGRKRQIREHFFNIDCPIIGDKKYYKKLDKNINIDSRKLYLHAFKLSIIKKNGKTQNFTAPIPDHIKKFCYLYKIIINKNDINKLIISNILKGAKN